MAVTPTPAMTQVPVLGKALISTANTGKDGTGTLGTVRAAGPQGDIIDYLVVQAIGTTTAGMVRLFVDDGTNIRLLAEISVTAATPSGTVQAFRAVWTPDGGIPLPLPNGSTLKASTHNAESFVVWAAGGQF